MNVDLLVSACFSTPGSGLRGPTAAFEGLDDREQKTLPEACYARPVWQTHAATVANAIRV